MNSISSKQKRFFLSIYIITIISFIIPIIEGEIKIEVCNYANIIVFIILTAITECLLVQALR